MTNVNHIAILMAMRDEAQSLIDVLNLSLRQDVFPLALPMRVYEGEFQLIRISLVLGGEDERYGVDYIGTQAATLSAYAAIQHLQPNVLISAGTAGGFAHRGADIGTVYLSDGDFVFHDRRVPLPKFEESSVGHFPSLNVRGMAKALAMPVGVVSSGSSLQKSEQDVAVIEQYQAVAKEMEAAAIAWVAWMHQTPFFAIKSITNLLDQSGASEDQFVLNLALACERLKFCVLDVLAYMEAKSLSDLAD